MRHDIVLDLLRVRTKSILCEDVRARGAPECVGVMLMQLAVGKKEVVLLGGRALHLQSVCLV